MVKQVVVLTISDKHNDKYDNSVTEKEGGYCVAGFEIGTPGKWIRLIGAHDHFKITNAEAVYQDGTLCQPLDVIEVDTIEVTEEFWNMGNAHGWGPDGDPMRYFEEYSHNLLEIQTENYYAAGKFRFIRKMSVEELLTSYSASNAPYIFGDTKGSLSVDDAKTQGHSLCFIKVEHLELEPRLKHGSTTEYKSHYKASFDYNGNRYENITVTDPDYAAELTDFDGLIFGDTYLVVSLGEEFNSRHYKLIAKIFEVSYTIENNTLNYFHAFRDCPYLKKYDHVCRDLYDNLIRQNKKQCVECGKRLQ